MKKNDCRTLHEWKERKKKSKHFNKERKRNAGHQKSIKRGRTSKIYLTKKEKTQDVA